VRSATALPKPLVLALGAFGLLALGGIVFSVIAHGQHRTAQNLADRAGRQLIALQGSPVSLTAANVARAAANREALGRQLDQLHAELQRETAGTIPDLSPFATPQDLYFDIVAMTEVLRREAANAGVGLADAGEEQFGFDDIIRRGSAPEDAERHAVYRDRMAVEYLVRALYAAQPQSLLAVQRERAEAPAGTTATRARRSPASAGLGDSFAVDPSVTAAVPGAIATQGIRLIFTGHTASLREFLATLAGFERPLVVRSVEVAPATPIRTAARPEAARPEPSRSGPFGFGFGSSTPTDTAAEAAVPMVRDNLSRFSVTVEAFRLLPEPPAVEAAP